MSRGREIDEQRVRLAGIETLVRRTPGVGTPTLFVHGNPTSSRDWVPFLEAAEGPGVAIDLPNFGRSERLPAERFDSSMHAYATYLGGVVDELFDGDGDFNLVVHDWGAIALHPVQRRAERLRRLAVINGVPLLGGYRWHWVARVWRTPGAGELFNLATTRSGAGLVLRQARPGFRRMPDSFINSVWEGWDRGTANAVLRLYRSADPEKLEAAGAHLARLDCPAIVAWGGRDPYLPPRFGRAYANRLPQAELVELRDAGHWPWIDRPELVERVAAFLAGR
jgi:pimeloyl-ACP methyl ester carboxylesterase